MKTGSGWRIIFNFLAWIFLSFVLIHLFAVFGVFVALAYPIIWLLQPSKTTCFMCQIHRDGEFCSFCQQSVKKNIRIFPATIRSITLNSLLILFFSGLSVLMVHLESKLLNHFGFRYTPKTASFIIPPKSQYRLGQIFALQIDVKNVKNPINAIQADLGFDPSVLEVVSVSTKDSFANVFLQKEIDNEGGWVRLSGGVPNPGFYGERGIFGTVYFMAKAPGLTKVDYLDSSMVLANDGKGSNILQSLPSMSYLILPERISEEEAILQQKLFQNDDSQLSMIRDGQLAFYDETTQNRVLGANSLESKAQQSWWQAFWQNTLQLLEQIDRLIIDFWANLLGD